MITQEQEVVTFDTAKKLDDLGIRIKTKYWWVIFNDGNEGVFPWEIAERYAHKCLACGEIFFCKYECVLRVGHNKINDNIFPAPTFTEELPEYRGVELRTNIKFEMGFTGTLDFFISAIISKQSDTDKKECLAKYQDKNPAEALGKMVCWLAEQKLLKDGVDSYAVKAESER